jgi:hypothetical protein
MASAKMANTNFDQVYKQQMLDEMPIFSEQLKPQAKVVSPSAPGKVYTPNQGISPQQLREWILEHPGLVQDIIQNSRDDEQVKLKVRDFISLIVSSNGEDNLPPTNFFISSAKYTGKSQEESSTIKCKMEVTLLESQWTMIPLFPDSVAITNSSVHLRNFWKLIDV